MKVDVKFDFATVYNVDKLEVTKGQKFTLFGDTPGKWFSDNDPVLSMVADNTGAKMSADNVGDSVVLILEDSPNLGLLKRLDIKIVSPASEQATNLNVTAGEPVDKNVS